MSINQKRYINAEDLYKFELVADPQVSPDGDQVVYCVSRVNRENEKKYTNLFKAALAEGSSRAFTNGDHTDSMPRWSPNGRRIAFLSNRDDEDQTQIYIIPTDGGEARKLTDVKGEFRSLQWSPDGLKILCQFRKMDQEAIDREDDEKKKDLGIVSRHITRVFFRYDGEGYLPRERWHICLFDSSSGDMSPLTASPIYDDSSPTWSPDGKNIAFLSNRSSDPDLDPDAVDLFTIPVKGGEPRKINTPLGYKQLPRYSPDGKWLAYLAQEGRGNWWQNVSLCVTPSDGHGQAKNLTDQYDYYVGNATLGDIIDPPTVAPVWSADSRSIYFQLTRHGNTSLQAIDIDGTNRRGIIEETGAVGAWSMDESNSANAYTFSSAADPGQIFTIDSDHEIQQVSQVNGHIAKEVALGDMEEIWFDGPDGNRLHGWIVKPPDFDPSKKYPSILEIHGGPYLQYGSIFFHEFHFLASKGYIVYFCNPRGGQGYGEEHAKAIHTQWGTVDYEDLMAWVDYIEEKPYIDRESMGVAGGSYGGYMTTWIIGHTDRFKAAVAQRVVSNTLSFVGSSDVNWVFHDPWGGGQPPWDDFESYWAQSPIAHIGQAKTPTLIIHSEQDMRCDPEQGVQVFVALKRLGVDTEWGSFRKNPMDFHGAAAQIGESYD